ncbi:hypothetical protein PG991_008682 [Apiospora marii]|uniref:Uncharacterized protein n=1 Tax=Apiospora marii TaxID=335849 RepID=A0ABR1RLE7_9PEZI
MKSTIVVEETAKQIEDRLGINWSPAQKQKYLDSIKTVYIKRLETPYPINDFYTAGTQKAQDEWNAYWDGKPLKDPRYNKGQRRGTKTLDFSQLQYVIEQDESVRFVDADTKELVMIVIRNFFPDEAMREAFTKVCLEVVERRRDDRREDPGQLCHFGYTCGSRHQPALRIATCNKRLNTPARREYERRLNYQAQGMASLGWNMLKSRLPDEIIQDYENAIADSGAPRMDMERADKNFSFPFHGKSVTFNDLDLAPPSGLCSINYSRFTHKENNGNRFFIACTTMARPTRPRAATSTMRPASNTVTSWMPSDYHGTTLYEMLEGPEKRMGYEVRPDGGINTGFSFEVSKMIRNAVKQGNKRKSGSSSSSSSPPSSSSTSGVATTSGSSAEEITVREPRVKRRRGERRRRFTAGADDGSDFSVHGNDSDSDYRP